MSSRRFRGGGGGYRSRERPLIGGWSDHARIGGYAIWNDPNMFSRSVLVKEIDDGRRGQNKDMMTNLLAVGIIAILLFILALFGFVAFVFIASRLMK